MPFGIGFIFLLMLMGGVAAYWGDRVGMLVGRSRLSVFGLRPKYTSRIVAVATGVLIVLFTLTTMLILSNSVRQALFGMDELQAEIVALSAEVSTFEQRRRDLEASNAALEERNRALEAETERLQEEKAGLEREIAAAKQEIEAARQSLAELQESLEVTQSFGNLVYSIAQDILSARFVVRSGDVLGTLLVDVSGAEAEGGRFLSGRDRVLANLRAAVDRLEEDLIRRGLGSSETGEALLLERVYVTEDGVFSFDEEQVLAQAVDLALVDAVELGVDSVIVQVTAVTNARRGDPVFAEFTRFVMNQRVFAEGEVVSEREFDPSRPRSEIFQEFLGFVRGEVGQIARNSLLPPDGDYGELSPAETFAVVDEIASYDRPVIVKAVAARDTWAYDALELRFEYEPVRPS